MNTITRTFLIAVLALTGLTATAREFNHPGATIDAAGLESLKQHVQQGDEPWATAWKLLTNNYKAKSTYTANAKSGVGGSDGTRQQAARDGQAAYLNMLEYYVLLDSNPTQAKQHAECAIKILNAWAKAIDYDLTPGELFMLPIGILVPAAELARIYPGWAEADRERFRDVCLNKWYPDLYDYLGSVNWPGWDGPTNKAILDIAVFCDREDLYDAAIDYYLHGMPASHPKIGTSSKYKVGCGAGRLGYMVWDNAKGLTVEMARDQPHAEIGISTASEFCEEAWLQGDDLFMAEDGALFRAFEAYFLYNIGHEEHWTEEFNDYDNNHMIDVNCSYAYRIDGFPGCEIMCKHAARLGVDLPLTRAAVALRGLTDYAWEGAQYTCVNYTTEATKSLFDALPKPEAPRTLTATPGAGRITLDWEPADALLTNGTIIQRAVGTGSFQNLYTFTKNTSRHYVDSTVVNGLSYRYRIRSVNNSGSSALSEVVEAVPERKASLPNGWTLTPLGDKTNPVRAHYTPTADHSFMLEGRGNSWGGTSDKATLLTTSVKGDFVFTAHMTDSRLTTQNGGDRFGLCVRDALTPTSRMVAVGFGDSGNRYTYHIVRSTASSYASWTAGWTHTPQDTWYRIERKGNKFTTYQSADGTDWHAVGTTTLSLRSTAVVGMYLCSTSSTASFPVYVSNVSLTTPDGTPIPTAFQAEATHSNRVLLSWENAAPAPATTYTLTRTTTSPSAVSWGGRYATAAPVTLATALTSTFFPDTTTLPETTYTYRLTATAMTGVSEAVETTVTTPALQFPAAPTGLTAWAVGSRATLSWDAVPDATSYTVERAQGESGEYTVIATVEGDTVYADTGIQREETYTYRVMATNIVGQSRPSETASVTAASQQKLTGTVIGSDDGTSAALDGNSRTSVTSDSADNVWAGLDMGEDQAAALTSLSYFPVTGSEAKMLGGWFEVANEADFSDAHTVYFITATPKASTWARATVNYPGLWRYLRYCAPDGSYGQVAEVAFYGQSYDNPKTGIVAPQTQIVNSIKGKSYDIAGRRLPAATHRKGINIINGHKYLIK